MWMLVMAVWKALARVLRHLGRGALLPLIAAMGVALFGVQPWTVAPVVLALIVAVWWPAIAADVLPVTMLVTGIWALMAAAVAPGARVGWAMARRSITFLALPPALHAPVHIYGPGRVAPAGGPWQVLFPARFAISRAGVVEQAGAKGALGAFTVKPWPGPGRLPPRPFPGGPHPVAGHGGGLLPAGLLVPLALLLLALGLWLTPRALARLRDRMPWLVPYLRRWAVENRWGVLLVPLAAFGLAVFGVHPWTVAAVAAAAVAAARWPRVAADLLPVTLAGFAAYGFAIASNWQSLAAGPAGHQVMYGAVRVSSPHMALLAGTEASVFLALAAWLAPRTIGAHARTLLRPGPDPELAGRVQRLTETRGHAIDAATAELRRIERDLHDGAQARLVALGMNLRAAERMLPASPQAALALVAEARETSSRALNDLRDVVRGICPPVLADRGLGHAVQALALDTPLPVRLDIDLPGRLAPPVESACYFAVTEILANAVRHSGARHVDIRIRHGGGTLRIEVADDGAGGADPGNGTGLRGVERRLGTFDGIMAVSSPPGGPTMIAMEVPCALSSPKIFSC